MLVDFYTGFCYSFILALAVLLAYFSVKAKDARLKLLFLVLSFLIVSMFCGLRFFVGNDYGGYYYIFRNCRLGYPTRIEPSFFLLNKIFSNSTYGYIYVLFVSSVITVWLLYKLLIKCNILYLGVFFLFTLNLLIMINDQVRQGIALSIFLYGFQYVEKKFFFKYSLFVILATTFHYTAILLLPLYFIRCFTFKPWMWIFLLLLVFFLHRIGLLSNIVVSVLEHTPIYGEIYQTKGVYFEAVQESSGLGTLYKLIIALVVAISYNKMKRNYYVDLFLIGSILNIFFVGFLLAERVSFYLLYANVVALPLLYLSTKKKIIRLFILVIPLTYFVVQSFSGLESHGAVPYRTFFLEKDLVNPPSPYFRDKYR
ncbi:EpsG family protein [uncultured Bacteroides sp.]|uniref:EpsG family protein n=1 Tax=uncultured Bacteroides sp. TaxID=162156 RepID=UPI002596B885|nr:EpsG family protein [uncultured Bacteroides sp.]